MKKKTSGGALIPQIASLHRYYWRALRWELLSRFSETASVKTEQGKFIVSTADRVIGRGLYCFRNFELDFTSKALAHLRGLKLLPPRNRGTVVDIGANMGVISIGLLNMNEFARAVAIEPEPGNYGLLRRNVALNGLEDRVFCIPFAASDSESEVRFELSKVNHGDHRVRTASAENGLNAFDESERKTITVHSARLDKLVELPPVDFESEIAAAWLDVQGYEGYVLRGGSEFFGRGIPVVSEVWPYGMKRAGISAEEFCRLASRFWSSYWVLRRGKFVRYPIELLGLLFDELDSVRSYDNVIFTP